ncbi:hypothetical protein PQZ11_07550 [Luminiphilus sp.]|jgi:hypothetical protein|nr:hypothetical protein [Luminiphilus sp.]MDA8619673.1 hypothetical protein [Luminiphilus sp.]MDC0574132.1 hypothetical protein [Luminiphilus sp.]MDC6472903.1 hypothetical protein [Luminiphilus sp.]
MGERSRCVSKQHRGRQQGVFILAIVTVLIVLAALPLMGAYNWAVVDWQTVLEEAPDMTEVHGSGR